MVERRKEFPALEARKEYLEHQYYQAQQQANDAAYAGKPDNAMLQWVLVIKAELDELRYALKVLTQDQSRIEISGRIGLLLLVALTAVFLTQVAILFNMGGG